MRNIDLLPTEVQTDLRAIVRDLLAEGCQPATVTAMYDGDRAAVAPLWRSLAVDLGLAGLLVPEEHGGAGATAREAAVILEELGRSLAPVPFLTSSVLATTAVLDGDPALLSELASGSRTAALALPWSTCASRRIPGVRGSSGTVTSVAGALEADLLLVPFISGDTVALHAIEASDVSVEPVSSLDMTRQLADVHLDGVVGEVVLPDASSAIEGAMTVTAALLASEQVGVAGWCLDETVAYLKVRKQFGRVVGGFQAIKHRLADLHTALEGASAAAAYAAAEAAVHDPDLPIASCVAQAYCSDVAVRAAEEAIQLHGGIGMTWEHPLHLYLKRAKADQLALGRPDMHREWLADLVNL